MWYTSANVVTIMIVYLIIVLSYDRISYDSIYVFIWHMAFFCTSIDQVPFHHGKCGIV